MEAVRVYTRYDLPNEKGETRRERNARLNFETPELDIPFAGEYLWDWFTRLSKAIHRVDFNGYYYNIPPSEIIAWCSLTNVDMTEDEYEIISAMDSSFCKEINTEIEANRTRKMEDEKRVNESKMKRRR